MRSVNTIDDVRALAGADTPVHPASTVKTGWRGIVREAVRHGEVIVTNHNRPEVVVLDVSVYADLIRRAQANDPLDVLTRAFDEKLAALDSPDGDARLRAIAASGIPQPAPAKRPGKRTTAR